MKKLLSLLPGVIACLLLISCQKEISVELPATPGTPGVPGTPGTPVGDIKGTYKFLQMHVKGTSTAIATMGTASQKSVTVSDYTSINNSGTITFSASTITSNDLAYDVDSMLELFLYENNVLLDSVEVPFLFSAPPSSASSPYKMIGTDSIYFSGGSIFMSGTTQQTEPGGAKLRREGDKLIMNVNRNKTVVQNNQGISVTTTFKDVATMTFQKI